MLYEEPSGEDGYLRDACVFREDIDIYDTMSTAIMYRNGVQVSRSRNACMPIEGHHLAFNGRRGRVEMRHRETDPFGVPEIDEILVMPNFGLAEMVKVPREHGGHFGGDRRLQAMLFDPTIPDPLHQRAGTRAGALSVLCGVDSVESVKTGPRCACPDCWSLRSRRCPWPDRGWPEREQGRTTMTTKRHLLLGGFGTAVLADLPTFTARAQAPVRLRMTWWGS
jgi:hypothetical protein